MFATSLDITPSDAAERLVSPPATETSLRWAAWCSVTSGQSTPRYIVGWATTRRRRKCARRCSSASCGRLANSAHPRSFGGWLRSIAARMAINRAVRRKPLATAGESLAAVSATQPTPLASMLARERQSQVRRGLSRLGDLDRKTLLAFYFEGRTLLEMSDQFQSPLGTIKRRLHVAAGSVWRRRSWPHWPRRERGPKTNRRRLGGQAGDDLGGNTPGRGGTKSSEAITGPPRRASLLPLPE